MTRYCSRTGKYTYHCRSDAVRAVKGHMRRKRSHMSVYWCTDCQGYHTTHMSYSHCKAIQQMAARGIFDAWKGREKLMAFYERNPELRYVPITLTKRQLYERSMRIRRPKPEKHRLTINNYFKYDAKTIRFDEWAYRRNHRHSNRGGC